MSNSNAFVLESVELKNWKTFSEATLNVRKEGLTGIVGQNGAGKSSFVDAILWALYGTRPKDVRKDELRRRNSNPETDPTSVRVIFTHAGQTVEVYRKMAGKSSTVTGTVFLDGQAQTKQTPATLNSWIAQRLGMDEAGFRTSVVVPQKELDSLVDARPAERRESIERLAGIEDMNKAVKLAREVENALASEIKLMPGSVDEVAEAQSTLEKAEGELEFVDSDLNYAEMDRNSSQEAKDQLEVDYSNLRTRLDKLREHESVTSELKSKIAVVTNTVENLQESIATEKASIPENVSPERKDLLGEEYREASHELTELTETFNRRRLSYEQQLRVVNDLGKRLGLLKTELDQAKGKFTLANEALESTRSLDLIEKDQEHQSEKENNSVSLLGRAESRIADVEESLTLLQSVHEDHSGAKCPTCQSDIGDPSELISKFQGMLTDSQEEHRNASEERSSARSRLSQLKSESSERQRLEEAVRASQASQETLEKTCQELEADLATQESLLGGLTLTDSDESTHVTEKELLENRIKAISAEGFELKHALERMEKVKAMEATLANEKGQLEKLASDLRDKEEFSSVAGVDATTLSQELHVVEQNLNQARTRYENEFAKVRELEMRQGQLGAQVKYAKQTLSEKSELVDNKLQAMKQLEKRSAVSDLLVEYRLNRIARIAPELSLSATDLISQMTHGRFVEVKVSESFEASVVKADGSHYGVAELSGGEKSIVALALRIAISTLVTGDNAGLLWLDEALPAQDIERRDAVLNVLRDLPIQQIVMINHTHEAEDVVDEVVRVVYHDDGSTIEYSNSQAVVTDVDESV